MVASKVGTVIAGKVGTGLMGRLATEGTQNISEDVIGQAVTTRRIDPRAALMSAIPGMAALTGGKKSSGGGSSGGGGLPVATGLINLGVSGRACKKPHSFEPDTAVLMADGTSRPIEDVNVGDAVVATDPETGESTVQPVTQLHRNTDNEFTDLTVKDQDGNSSVLKTTQNHPFWNETQQAWTDASDLKPGDELKVVGYGSVVVSNVHSFDGSKEMHDLTVANIHTYYVFAGSNAALVHNINCEDGEVNNDVIQETMAAAEQNKGVVPHRRRSSLVSQHTMTMEDATATGLAFLGPNHTDVSRGRGVYRSENGEKGFRVDPDSLAGAHWPGEPHVHLEVFDDNGKHLANNHIPLARRRDG